MRLTLARTYEGDDCTLGVLTVSDMNGQTLVLQTIEKPWVRGQYAGGVKGASCVPKGTYKLECHNSEAHPRTWALVNPELGVVHWPVDAAQGDRTVVLIHVANYAAELRGCIGVGLKTYHDDVRGVRMVTNSRQAMKALQDALTWSDEHEIEIR